MYGMKWWERNRKSPLQCQFGSGTPGEIANSFNPNPHGFGLKSESQRKVVPML